ncbi:HAD family hydrolase [Ligilactobacillus apodemi]|uniref:HAD superfamily hydrolase n=1 Tax=Ligilactobacillus apodemi DSM 16634 = JCM 16172 TaxID=1423724 RepID=A0A0R1TZA4_9LACO|nr:HAD family phosphatase [Ligilactobacillus apodemi]KRL84168.1 HAD superfamily hydrolase [Ligilactobacillus apodemi DSM 16634 = JCM 16172]
MKVKLVIFDMDGVVFDSEKVYFEANKMAADQLGMKNYTLEYYQQFIGAGTEPMLAQMAKDYGSRELVDRFYAMSMENVYPIVEAGKLALKPGFKELTAYLDEQNIPYVIASSNFRKDIEYYLEETGISGKFAHIVSADDVTHAKPSPEIFNKAWQKMGNVAKEESLVIEDSINGVKAANNADIPVIMVPDIIQPTEYEKEHTLAILPNLVAVKEFIAK